MGAAAAGGALERLPRGRARGRRLRAGCRGEGEPRPSRRASRGGAEVALRGRIVGSAVASAAVGVGAAVLALAVLADDDARRELGGAAVAPRSLQNNKTTSVGRDACWRVRAGRRI